MGIQEMMLNFRFGSGSELSITKRIPMHGVAHITPEVGIVMVIGLAIFIVVYRLIFRKPRN